MQILFSWIGRQDLISASKNEDAAIAVAAKELLPDLLVLLNNFDDREVSPVLEHLAGVTTAKIMVHRIELSSPTRHEEIYPAVLKVVNEVISGYRGAGIFFHLSPGTPAMHAVWILLAKTQVKASLVETTAETGFRIVDLPFSISLEYYKEIDPTFVSRRRILSAEELGNDPDLSDVIFRSEKMTTLLNDAITVASYDVPVLIEGETGTGKEVLAGLIHKKSGRNGKPFIAINCGAIPKDIIESELFGYVKGAFTGAVADKKGYFEAAGEGTIFLDEIGDLPPEAQVKILRILNDGTFTRVGDTTALKSHARVIAATHKSLAGLVAEEKFREDLYFRLAVVRLFIPPLRERREDLVQLVKRLFPILSEQMDRTDLHLSAEALEVLQLHDFPGNTRELITTLQRIIIFAGDNSISAEEAERALLKRQRTEKEPDPVGQDLDIHRNIQKLFTRMYDAARGKTDKKKEIAAMLGFENHQTLDNWIKRYYKHRNN